LIKEAKTVIIVGYHFKYVLYLQKKNNPNHCVKYLWSY
jgi:hypothetical protein